MEGVENAAPSGVPVVEMRVEDIKGFLSVVQLLKWSNKQVGTSRVDARGLTLTATDDSKCLQGVATFTAEYFASYMYRGEEEDVFGVSLSGLVDCLSVMATCDAEAQLVLRWPDANASLAFEVVYTSGEDYRPIETVLHSQLACEEAERPVNYDSHIVEPCSELLISTHVLKEVVDDLEWPGASVKVIMDTRPTHRVRFDSEGLEVGRLQIDVDMTHEKYMAKIVKCVPDGVCYRYKYKHMKIALNLSGPTLQTQASGQPPISKILVDSNGLMKIHHHIKSLPHASRGPRSNPPLSSVIAAAYFTLSPEDAVDDMHDRDLGGDDLTL